MVETRSGPPMLEVRGLDVYYGRSHALQGVDLTLTHGVLSVVGRNGMGKTTLCKTIMGLVHASGGSVRVPRLVGTARMMDMMLTGRVYTAQEGLPLGFAQYLVEDGAGYAKGLELAHKMAGNAPLTNFGVIQALPRIAEADPRIGYVMESLMASVAQAAPEAKARVRAFLEKRAAKVERPE